MTQEYEEIKQDMEHIKQLRTAYEKACNDYLSELLKMWELDAHYGYWIGDEVGGVYDYDGGFTINMEDIIYCVENSIDEDEVLAWEDYLLDAAEFGFSLPNLPAWHKGCPRTDEATFARLRKMKQNLYDAVEEEKSRRGQEDSKETDHGQL